MKCQQSLPSVHSRLTGRDTGCRAIQSLECLHRQWYASAHVHVGAAFTWWGYVLTRADSWLRGCPCLPIQIYDWEDLCPVGVQAAQTYLADRQPCRFPQSGFMFRGGQRCWGSTAIFPFYSLFELYICSQLCRPAPSGSQPPAIYWECNYLCSGVERKIL